MGMVLPQPRIFEVSIEQFSAGIYSAQWIRALTLWVFRGEVTSMEAEGVS